MLIEHLEKLRHFQRATQYRSISEAAEASGISQAGLSKSIAALESVLETQLFIRSPQGLILTKEGELALQVTKKILGEASSLEANLRSLKASKTPSRLRIGMYDSIAVYFFSDLAAYLSSVYQNLSIQLLVDTSTSLANAVKSGEIDMAIGVNLESKKNAKQDFFLLFEDQYSFYASAKKDGSKVDLPLLIHPQANDSDGTTIEEILSKIIARNGVHRIFNFETIKTLTLQGIGIGVLPTQVARPLVQQGQLQAVQIPKLKSTFGRHNIGFLASESLLQHHREFAQDVYRLGIRWSKG